MTLPKYIGLSACLVVTTALPRAAISAEPVRSVEIVEASAFLESYRVDSAAQASDFYALYSDRARVHVRVQGREQGMVFQGRSFKTWGEELLQQGRAGPDSSIFYEPTVEQRGSRLLIRAKRYSIARCYWDLHYEVGIEREGAAYRIVDERLTTEPSAHCSELAASAARFAAPIIPVEPLPPAINARALDDQNSRWHPMSQQKLADKAMQLAQQIAAARAAQSRGNKPIASSYGPAIAIPPTPRPEGASSAAASRVAPDVDLRVTPEESR